MFLILFLYQRNLIMRCNKSDNSEFDKFDQLLAWVPFTQNMTLYCKIAWPNSSLVFPLKKDVDWVSARWICARFMAEYKQLRDSVPEGALRPTAQFCLSYLYYIWLVLALPGAVKTNDFHSAHNLYLIFKMFSPVLADKTMHTFSQFSW